MVDLVQQMQTLPIIPNSLAIGWLGQMGLAIKGPDATVCMDVFLTVRSDPFWVRAFDPPLEPEALSNVDYYFITHEHGDHLDPKAVVGAATASPAAKFIAPAWCNDKLADLDIGDDRIINPAALEPFALGQMRVTAVPGAHYDKEHDPQKGYRWLGYMLEWNGVTFYHSGDTIIYPGYIETLQSLPTPDIALLPVNGRDYYRDARRITGNLLPVEAARLARDLGWDTLLVGHNDMFPNNAIPNSHIVDALATVAPRQKFKFMQPNELYYYVRQ